MNKQPIVIEFIGLPGAGKTTTAQIAIDKLSRVGFRCFGLSTLDKPETLEKKKGGLYSKLKMLNLFVYSCIFHSRIAADALIFVLNVRPIRATNIRRFVQLIARLPQLGNQMKDGYDFIVLDQGLIQAIWSIVITGEHPAANRYLERVLTSILEEFPLFVIMIDVETELAIDRIISRPTMRSRFDRMSALEAETVLSKHKELFEQIVQSTDKFEDTGYLNINGTRPVLENVDLIVPFLLEARQGKSA